MGADLEVEMDVRELVVAGIDGFTEKVRAVPDDRWDAPTPCSEWSVRDLVNHMTSEHLWAPHLLRGETLNQVGDRYDGDVLGDDPADAWERAADASRALWLEVAPGTPVHLSIGPTPVEEYAEQMHLDLVVHGWDLARGAAIDDSIDPAIAERELGYVETVLDDWPGLFAAPVETPSDVPGAVLVARLGRDPDWDPAR
jgi:uncharacterized protein (TIGR03086 family)